MAAYGLNLDDLRTTISNANQNGPKGTLDGPANAYTINTNDQIRNADDYGNVVVAYKNGAPVRLKDVATLVSGAENSKLGGWMNSTPALILNVQRQPGANVVDVVDRIHDLLPSLQADMPAGVDVVLLTDRTTTIRASVKDVEFELVLAVVLVVLVIWLFLRNIPATIIPSLSVPLSLIGTFAVMYLANFSLNNLSLMALTIATGFVVDDAIVMIENISRYIEAGEPPLEAALKGAGQIGFTIISLTVSLIAVLIPLLFMQDVVGRLFREFAVTLAVTILISAVVSLTLVPMMCAKLLKHRPPNEHAQTDSGKWFTAVVDWYGKRLTWVLDHQRLTLWVAIGTLVLTGAALCAHPQGILSRSGHGTDSRRLRGDGVDLLRRHGGPPAGAGRGDSQGSGRRQPLIFHRRRRQQRDLEQRALPDQLEAARSDRSATVDRCDPPPAAARPPTSRASRCTCSRFRI